MERKVIDYLILEGESRARMIGIVNEHIKLGYEPIGHVLIKSEINENAIPEIRYKFFQTLVKYSKGQ